MHNTIKLRLLASHTALVNTAINNLNPTSTIGKTFDMYRISLKIRKSNWETVAFLLIYDFLTTTGKHFVRPDLMKNVDKSVNWLQHLNHKKNPEHPEETLQRTIQNLRDKGYIIFHGQGEYELTESGITECYRVADELNVQFMDIDDIIQTVKEEYNVESIEKAKALIKKLSPDQIKMILEKLKNKDTN